MRASDLLYLGQQLTKAGQVALRSALPEMQTAESIVVAHLIDRRFSTVTEIAQHTGYAQSRISKAVTTLKERGLVQSRVDAADRRRSVVYLIDNPLDEKTRDRSADPVLRDLLAEADEQDRAEIVGALEKLVALLRSPVPSADDQAADVVLDRWAKELGLPLAELEKLSPRDLASLLEVRRKPPRRL